MFSELLLLQTNLNPLPMLAIEMELAIVGGSVTCSQNSRSFAFIPRELSFVLAAVSVIHRPVTVKLAFVELAC